MTSALIATEAKGFKFGDTQEGEPSSIQKVAKLDTYLVAYKDGEGKNQARIVLRLPGADKTFVINERISGTNIVTSAYNWFHKAFVTKLELNGLESPKEESAESI